MAIETTDSLTEYMEREIFLGNVVDLGKVLCNLLDENKMPETKLRSFLCRLDELLRNYNRSQVKFGDELFPKLLRLLYKDQGISSSLATFIVECIKLNLTKFPEESSKNIIKELWCLCSDIQQEPHAPIIWLHCFDLLNRDVENFLYEGPLPQVIQQLLLSPERKQHKIAISLMNQKLSAIEKIDAELADRTLSLYGWNDKQNYTESWSTYIKIWTQYVGEATLSFEDLEELAKLRETTSKQWRRIWFDLLFVQLLADKNLKIKRIALEHLLYNDSFNKLSGHVSRQFLLASNEMFLYDINGEFLDHVQAGFFVNNSRVEFLEIFLTIDTWNLVPIHFWLTLLDREIEASITFDLLMRLAIFINKQSQELREVMIKFISTTFVFTIESLRFREYIEFIETLYNIEDGFYQINTLETMWLNAETADFSHFSQRFYQIITNRIEKYDAIVPEGRLSMLFEKTRHRFRNVPKEQLGCLPFLLVFNLEQSEAIENFIRYKYDFDLSKLRSNGLEFTDFHNLIAAKLVWSSKVANSNFLFSKCLDLYTKLHLNHWTDLRVFSIEPFQLLNKGDLHTYRKLLKLLGAHDAPNVAEQILDVFIEVLKENYLRSSSIDICKYFVQQVYKYAKVYMIERERESLLYKLLNIDQMNNELVCEVLSNMEITTELILHLFLHGEPSKGVKRMEELYEELIIYQRPNDKTNRQIFTFKQPELVDTIIQELLRINKQLTIKIPEYHEFSKVHRLKIRIALAIFTINESNGSNYWSEELWSAALAEYNAENVRYLYELMIIAFAKNVDTILEKLQQIQRVSAPKQLALLSIVYNYSMLRKSQINGRILMKILDKIIPLTMEGRYVVQQYATVILHRLCHGMEYFGLDMSPAFYQRHKEIFAKYMGIKKMSKYLSHPRFKLHAYYENSATKAKDMVLFVTNAPLDECGFWSIHNSAIYGFSEEFVQTRKQYVKVMKKYKRPHIPAADDLNLDFGPYVKNPERIDKIIFKKKEIEKSEMQVVASLVNELDNLNGIVNACKELGIKNIAVESKRLLDEKALSSLQSLNLHVVKPDNLISFLEKKKTEGYKILGADQTAEGEILNKFKFPSKCVLVLGNDKEGIPVHLIPILDHSIKIPQLGEVLSFNVDVINTLVMWEFNKQHPDAIEDHNKMSL